MISASLGETLLAFALLQSVLQGQLCLLLQVFLDFLLFIPVPYNEKDIFFWMLFIKGLLGLHRTFNFSFSHITGQGIDLDHHDIEWFALRSFCRF